MHTCFSDDQFLDTEQLWSFNIWSTFRYYNPHIIRCFVAHSFNIETEGDNDFDIEALLISVTLLACIVFTMYVTRVFAEEYTEELL